MKYSKLIAVFFPLVIFFSSCKDDTINNDNTGTTTAYIRGTVVNWQSGRMNLKAVCSYIDASSHTYVNKTLDSTFIEADRSFVFKLVSPLEIPLDSFYFPNYGNCSPWPAVNPPGALFKNIQLHVYNSNDTAIGFIYLSDADSNKPAENTCYFMYSGQTASISGNRTCTFGSGHEITSVYDLSFSNAWFPVNWNIYNVDSTHIFESYKNNTTAELKWRYQLFLYP